ncbi:hypothetical protein [Flavobacterium sp. 7A]|uniref:hypothetical protein n=1 Tax=Flavobacterium sp. 7A TaxID=2940571 RepID=UPI002226B5D8|nr:hypothetical protein [Flavobacterium sp. 7A]MCW2120185.1 hypothetical protein [Flavobacterium sp. 7A]
MKTKIIIASLLTTVFAMQIQAQYNSVNAVNNEISDNLDLRAVASLFGESRNLQDFERKLNDPIIQISNLDLNYDNQVDYLRVIETVDRNTHVVIIQSVLDRDVYQDVATIDVERDRYNKIQVQFVGNEYIYGSNYIYEPVYYRSPLIYASFYVTNYRPYVSNCYWNSYPSYYNTWNPYPSYRYRSNIQVSINFNNSYNYVSSRRSNYAAVLYNSNRSNGYERMHPNYNFASRNSSMSNRYDLDQRRSRSYTSYNDSKTYREVSSRGNSMQSNQNQRGYATNNGYATRQSTPQRNETSRDYTQNRATSARETIPQRTETSRDYTQNRTTSSREVRPQRTESSRDYSQNRATSSRNVVRPQSSQNTSRSIENRSSSSRESTPQRSENSGRNYSTTSNSNTRT